MVKYWEKRASIQIMTEMLEIINSGVTRPTHIMYKANLDWIRLKKYMSELEKKGLVTYSFEHTRRKLYKITDKGVEALKFWRGFSNHFSLGK